MNSFYIRQKNLAYQSIKQAETYKKQAEDKIKNLKAKPQSSHTDYDRIQIEKAKSSLSNYSKEIENLQERLVLINSRKLDHEYQEEVDKAAKKKASEKKKLSDKFALKEKEDEDKASNLLQTKNTNFVNDRQIDNYNKKFDSIASSLSEKIKRNLKEMPNNKGYIFKGIWFFGELPPEKNKPVVMFENLYTSNVFRTHEIDDNYRCVYDKSGKNKRVLVSKEERNKFGRNNIFF